jgi:hypothetical protein
MKKTLSLFMNLMKRTFLFAYCILVCNSLQAQTPENPKEGIYGKLFGELKKYAVAYDTFNVTNYPVLSGNTAIGGLMDPLGRGVYNIEVNDLFLASDRRIFGPGMMLDIAQFSGCKPESYCQRYNLENGILITDVCYASGAYHSEMFFSQDDKELMVYRFANTGNNSLVCNINTGLFDLSVENYTNQSLYGISSKSAFTCLHYFLQSNIALNMPAMPDSKDIYVNVPPGEILEIVLSLRVTKERTPLPAPKVAAAADLMENHIREWRELWQSMGFVILPEGDYAQTFYRSLHWLQCTAGSSSNLPGENQFATFTSGAASAYQFHGEAMLNRLAWTQQPFTYGAAGWSAYAYLLFGNRERAENMLAAFYRPEALRDNVTAIYPVGYHEYVYDKPKGRYEYLSYDNPDAFCFAHEMLHDGRNHPAPLWDKQLHIQAFAPGMFYRYGQMYEAGQDTVYSVMRGEAEFWRMLLHYDAAKKSYSIPPALSLTENLFESDLLDALIAAQWTLKQASVLAEKRNADASLRKQWKQIAENIKIKDSNGIYLEYGGDDGSRAGAGYQGIRGYAYLGFPTLEAMKGFSAKKVNKSLDQCWERNKKGEGMITFIANWFALTDAYWGRAEEAYEKSSYCLTQLDPSGTAMCEQNKVLYYFLTSYASYTIVPVAMVLQSVNEEIKVFPAVPKAFNNISFYNLPAINGVRVSGEMKEGEIQYVRFEKDGKTLLETTGKTPVTASFVNGKLVLKK